MHRDKVQSIKQWPSWSIILNTNLDIFSNHTRNIHEVAYIQDLKMEDLVFYAIEWVAPTLLHVWMIYIGATLIRTHVFEPTNISDYILINLSGQSTQYVCISEASL